MVSPNPLEASPKLFTVEEANKTLPLVRAIVADIVEQLRVVDTMRQRLGSLGGRKRRPRSEEDPYAQERSQSEGELEQEEARLQEYLLELEKLGVEFKGADGLCDFPSQRDGRMIYLCWRLGEDQVEYWHEVGTGYDGRQPLKSASRPRPRIDAEP